MSTPSNPEKPGFFKKLVDVSDLVDANREAYIQMILVELEQEPALQAPIAEMKKELGSQNGDQIAEMLRLEYKYIAKLEGTGLDAKLEASLENLKKISNTQSAYGWVTRGVALHHANDKQGEKREFLKSVLRETYVVYVSSSTIEKVKFRLINITLFGFVILLVIWTGLFCWTTRIIFLLFIFGLCGAFVSIFQRISTITNARENTRNLISLIHAPLGLWFSLVFGTTFPVLAVLLICSGILHTSFFPRIHSVVEIRKPYREFHASFDTNALGEIREHQVQMTNTSTLKDAGELEHLGYLDFDKYFSELLMLAFISGFSERFITDAVDAFSRKLMTQNDNKQ